MEIGSVLAWGGVFAFVATILAFIYVIPENKQLSPFLSALRDIFNFRRLLIEEILKFFYVLSTLSCVLIGFFMLFWSLAGTWMGYCGLLLMVVGPIVVRIIYEFNMMIVLAVKNIMEINRKIGAPRGEVAQSPVTPPTPDDAPPAASDASDASAPVIAPHVSIWTDSKWEEAQRVQGITVGKCALCGAKRKELVHAEFKDFFGNAEYNMCYSCFSVRKATPKNK